MSQEVGFEKRMLGTRSVLWGSMGTGGKLPAISPLTPGQWLPPISLRQFHRALRAGAIWIRSLQRHLSIDTTRHDESVSQGEVSADQQRCSSMGRLVGWSLWIGISGIVLAALSWVMLETQLLLAPLASPRPALPADDIGGLQLAFHRPDWTNVHLLSEQSCYPGVSREELFFSLYSLPTPVADYQTMLHRENIRMSQHQSLNLTTDQ